MIYCVMRLLPLCAALLGAAGAAERLGDMLDKYFKSEISQIIVDVWKQNQLSYENSLKRALVSDVGASQANIYVAGPGERPLLLAPGLLSTDHVVELLLSRLTLRALPRLAMEPQVTISAPGGFARLYASLRGMLVDAQYVVFRNASAVRRGPGDLPRGPGGLRGPGGSRGLRGSPFSQQQVKKEGNVTVSAEECSVSGHVVLRLDGAAARLGHDTLRVRDCKYTIEIDSGLETPPVIEPYFSQDTRKVLNRILTKPVKEMLVSKLQAFFFSNMNLSSIFQDKLDNFRKKQARAFDKTSARLVAAAARLNRAVTQSSGGAMSVAPAQLAVGELFQGKMVEYKFTISDMTLNGLESAYSSSNGGPINDTKITILDQIRYDVLQVHGQMQYSDAAGGARTQRFLAQLRDVAVDVTLEPRGRRLRAADVYVPGWRKIELSITNLMHKNVNRQFVYDLIAGYLESALLGPLGVYVGELYNNALDDSVTLPTDPPDPVTSAATATDCDTTDAAVTTACHTPETSSSLDTTWITTDAPDETTCVTTDAPDDTTSVTEAPDETTCVTTDATGSADDDPALPTEPDDGTTCVTTDATDDTTDDTQTEGIQLSTRCTTKEPIVVRNGINVKTDDFEIREVRNNVLRH